MSHHRRSRHRGFCRASRRSRSYSISDRQLYRDKKRGKIGGVCAGLAAYFDMQIWLVRILAVTALLFMPQIVFFAYLIAVFVLPTKEQLLRSREEALEDDVEKERSRQSRFDDELNANDEVSLNTKRRKVRQFRERFDKLDKRMRDLESYITSSQFELNKEFGKI